MKRKERKKKEAFKNYILVCFANDQRMFLENDLKMSSLSRTSDTP